MSGGGLVTITTPTDRAIVVTRWFDAPRVMVFDAMYRPELLRRWYGPLGWTLEICEIDFRVGGAWRFVSRDPRGRQIGQFGIYREIVAPERVVNTEAWEDWNPGEVLTRSELREHGGQTLLTVTMEFPSPEVRDLLIKSGMTSGMEESYGKLTKLLTAALIADERIV